jgi:glucose-6-phosphate 1-dehydrogenase
VQITVAEQIGVEHCGHYYDQAGALRDMIQNHLIQVLCLTVMEPMISLADNEIRNRKVDVLQAVRPISVDEVPALAVRGQCDAGWMDGNDDDETKEVVTQYPVGFGIINRPLEQSTQVLPGSCNKN